MKKILVSLMLLVMTALSAHAQFEKEVWYVDVTVCAIEDTFVQHGSVEELRRMLKLDADSLYDRIKHIISTDCTE